MPRFLSLCARQLLIGLTLISFTTLSAQDNTGAATQPSNDTPVVEKIPVDFGDAVLDTWVLKDWDENDKEALKLTIVFGEQDDAPVLAVNEDKQSDIEERLPNQLINKLKWFRLKTKESDLQKKIDGFNKDQFHQWMTTLWQASNESLAPLYEALLLSEDFVDISITTEEQTKKIQFIDRLSYTQANLAKKQGELDGLILEFDRLTTQFNDLEKKLTDETKTSKERIEKLEKDKNAELNAKLAERKTVKEQEEKISNLKDQVKHLGGTDSENLQQIKTLTTELDTKIKELEKAQNRNDVLNGNLASIQTKLTNLSAENTATKAQLEQLQAQAGLKSWATMAIAAVILLLCLFLIYAVGRSKNAPAATDERLKQHKAAFEETMIQWFAQSQPLKPVEEQLAAIAASQNETSDTVKGFNTALETSNLAVIEKVGLTEKALNTTIAQGSTNHWLEDVKQGIETWAKSGRSTAQYDPTIGSHMVTEKKIELPTWLAPVGKWFELKLQETIASNVITTNGDAANAGTGEKTKEKGPGLSPPSADLSKLEKGIQSIQEELQAINGSIATINDQEPPPAPDWQGMVAPIQNQLNTIKSQFTDITRRLDTAATLNSDTKVSVADIPLSIASVKKETLALITTQFDAVNTLLQKADPSAVLNAISQLNLEVGSVNQIATKGVEQIELLNDNQSKWEQKLDAAIAPLKQTLEQTTATVTKVEQSTAVVVEQIKGIEDGLGAFDEKLINGLQPLQASAFQQREILNANKVELSKLTSFLQDSHSRLHTQHEGFSVNFTEQSEQLSGLSTKTQQGMQTLAQQGKSVGSKVEQILLEQSQSYQQLNTALLALPDSAAQQFEQKHQELKLANQLQQSRIWWACDPNIHDQQQQFERLQHSKALTFAISSGQWLNDIQQGWQQLNEKADAAPNSRHDYSRFILTTSRLHESLLSTQQQVFTKLTKAIAKRDLDEFLNLWSKGNASLSFAWWYKLDFFLQYHLLPLYQNDQQSPIYDIAQAIAQVTASLRSGARQMGVYIHDLSIMTDQIQCRSYIESAGTEQRIGPVTSKVLESQNPQYLAFYKQWLQSLSERKVKTHDWVIEPKVVGISVPDYPSDTILSEVTGYNDVVGVRLTLDS